MINVTINTAGVSVPDHTAPRRTTCDKCWHRRVCSYTWVRLKITFRGNESESLFYAGNMCAACRAELEKEA